MHLTSLTQSRFPRIGICGAIAVLFVVGLSVGAQSWAASLALNLCYIDHAQMGLGDASSAGEQGNAVCPELVSVPENSGSGLSLRVLLACLGSDRGRCCARVISNRASQLDVPRHSLAVSMLNDAYAAQGQFESMLIPEDLAVRANCGYSERNSPRVCLFLARVAAARQDWDTAADLYRRTLTAFITATGAIPGRIEQEWRWLEVRRYSAAQATRVLDARQAYFLALNQAKLGCWSEAVPLLEWLAGSEGLARELGNDRVARLWYWRGRAHEHAGQSEQAVECYERAWGLEPRLPELYERLGRHYQAMGRTHEVEDLLESLRSKRPLVEVNAPLKGWQLDGYDVDLWEVETAPFLDLTFYWSPLAGDSVPAPGWLAAGGRWIERREAVNLIANPDFSLGDEPQMLSGVPFWQSTYRNSDPHQIVVREYSLTGMASRSLCVTKDGTQPRAGLRSARIPALPGEYYLLSGQVAGTPEAIPWLGIAWWDHGFHTVGQPQVVSQAPPAIDPQFRSVIAQVSEQVRWGWVLITQYPPDGAGTVCFDNLLLVSLPDIR